MTVPSSAKAVQKRLRSLNRGLKGSLDTDAEALHRTRVATRRLREALPLFSPAHGPHALGNLKHLIQATTRLLGGVREMDVALGLVDTFAAERPELEPALVLVRAAMAKERLERLDQMRRRVDPRRLRRASRDLARWSGQFEDDSRSASVLADRLAERSEALRRTVTRAGMLYASERLHAVRVAAKKLRYALELAHEVRAAATARLVRELRQTQQRLGLLHDLEIVERHARRALAGPEVPEAAAGLTAATLSLLDARIHAQHADYLAHRESLLRAADRARLVGERIRARRSE